MLVRAAAVGDLNKAMQQEVGRVAGALKRAVTAAGQQVQADLRSQARGGGFKDGGRAIANSWRLAVYPRPGVGPNTLHPAALVWSRMPTEVDAFDRGVLVTAGTGKYLAYPTGYNAAGGRRNASRRGGVKVTTQQMAVLNKKRPREAFYIRSKSNPNVLLWCLRIYEGRGLSRRSRIKIFGGSNNELFTGNRKGRTAAAKALLKQRFVPMFFLVRQVVLRKRLNIDQVRAKAPGIFAREAVRELSR